MPSLKATILLELDGVPLPGSPFVRRVEVGEAVPSQQVKAGTADSSYSQLSPDQIASLRAFFCTTDAAVKLRLDGQSDAGIELGPNGLVLIMDATLDAGAATNATVNNAAATDTEAKLVTVAAGD